MPVRLAIAALLLLAAPAAAQSAKDELEQQLKEMVGNPPTKLLIEYEGLDQPNYKLVEVSFELDGSSLPVPDLEKLNGEGKHLVFHGDIRPGKHSLETTVVLTDVSGALFSYEAGYKWTVKNTRSFEQQPGLEVQVLVVPELNPGEKDAKKKFALKSTATPKMLAKLEDGTMPEAPKPNLAAAKTEADAGTAAAELSPAEKAKLAKQEAAEAAKRKKEEAAEEAKRKKDEAAAAKAAAIEEKKRQREDALAARKAAAEEKKRQREEALAAKRAAAEEKKRQRDEALAAKSAPPPAKEKEPVAAGTPSPAEPAPTPPAPEPVAEIADAGTTVAVAEPPKSAPAPAEPAPAPAGEGGFGVPLPVIIGIGVALLGIIIFVATRKRSPPQY